jgi:hypothetical protein
MVTSTSPVRKLGLDVCWDITGWAETSGTGVVRIWGCCRLISWIHRLMVDMWLPQLLTECELSIFGRKVRFGGAHNDSTFELYVYLHNNGSEAGIEET